MNAVVLAGGYGTRLKPLTDQTVKPMLTVCNRPIVDYCVAQLYHYGIKDIVFTLGFKPTQITEWAIGYQNITTKFCVENVALGTLGGVKLASDYLQDTFIVLSGDGISDINLNALLNRHNASKALVTMVVTKHFNPTLYGVCNINKDFVTGFVEKPHNITAPSYVNCGLYVVNKSALKLVDKDNCDFAKDLFPILVNKGQLAYYEHKGYWQDIGDINSYYQTNFDILKSGSFYPFVDNFLFDRYKSKLIGAVSPSIVNVNAKVEGFINECIVGNCNINNLSFLQRCLVLDGANVNGNYQDCIIGSNFVLNTNNFTPIPANTQSNLVLHQPKI